MDARAFALVTLAPTGQRSTTNSVVGQFSNRGLCVERFCKPLVCGASAGSWFSPRSAHGRRMMGKRGSAFQGLKRAPRAAAN